jgi:hypothetical protein
MESELMEVRQSASPVVCVIKLPHTASMLGRLAVGAGVVGLAHIVLEWRI